MSECIDLSDVYENILDAKLAWYILFVKDEYTKNQV